jgi:ribosomal protein S27AE
MSTEPEAPEITEAECRRCGTQVAGLNGRYACGVCGWVNKWDEGYKPLPEAETEPEPNRLLH